MKKHLKNESGQAMVLVALSLVVIMGFGAFTVDIGRGAMQQSELQNIADAAALAGAQDLPSSSIATNTAISYAGTNGLLATQNNVPKLGDKIVVTTDSTKIQVVVTRNLEYTFAKVLGFENKEVSARAVATKSAGGLGPVFDYAIFSGNKYPGTKMESFSTRLQNVLNVTGSGHVVSGSIHSNYQVNIGSMVVTGVASAVGTVTGSKITTKSPGSPYVPMPDFSSVLPTIKAAAQKAGQYYTSSINKKDVSLNVTQPIYVEGDAKLTGISFSGDGCIYATGKITITGSGDSYDSNSSICIYSGYTSERKSDYAIDFAGSKHAFNGMLYAPNGSIGITGSNYTINGCVVGRVVDFAGSDKVINATDVSDSFPYAETTSISLME
jgi:Flp pilus assembly protein TadG